MIANKPVRVFHFFLSLLALAALLLALGCTPRKAPPPQIEEDLTEEPVLGEHGEEITPEELFDMKRLGRHYRALTPQEQAALETPTEMDFQLDNEDNEEIQRYFELFTQEKRELFSKWLRRAQIYLPFVRDVLDQYKLPHDLAILPFIESGYNPRAISRAKAGGMWQFIVGTSSRYGLVTDAWVDQRFDPYLSTHAAAKYLKDLYGQFGDWYLALAAYNAGEAKIAKALEATGAGDFNGLVEQNHKLSRRGKLRQETKSYVPQFLATIKIVRNLESLGFEPLNWNAAPPLTDVELPKGTDLLGLAKSCDMNWEQFAAYNPSFLRMTSSPITTSLAHIPPEYHEAALAYLANPPAKAQPEVRKWKVRKGDTLKSVARKFGVSPSAIQSANHLKSQKLAVGSELLIPSKGFRDVPPAWSGLASDAPTGKRARKSKVQAAPEDDEPQPKSKPSKKGKDAAKAKVREPRTYTIHEGDTLYSLAKREGLSVDDLSAQNNLKPGTALKVGQKLSLPDQGAAGEEPVTVKAKSKSGKEPTVSAKSGKSPKSAKSKKDRSSKKGKSSKDKEEAPASKSGTKTDSKPDSKSSKSAKDSKKAKDTRYEVKKGDTLYSIARKYGVTPEDIKKSNGIKSRDIQPGESLKVPR
jgi:membrane-bound lytic murein transglycosylase D